MGACDDEALQHAVRLLAAMHRWSSAAFVSTDGLLPGADIAITFDHALALRRTFFALCERDDARSAALENAMLSVLLVELDAVVRHANARARTILSCNDGLTVSRGGQLRLRDGNAQRRLLFQLSAVCAIGMAPILRAGRLDGARPYLLRLVHFSPLGSPPRR